MNNSTFLRLFYNAELLIFLVIFYPITAYFKKKLDRSASFFGGIILGLSWSWACVLFKLTSYCVDRSLRPEAVHI